MNRSRYSLFLVTLTACACLGALGLRIFLLRTAFDTDGLLRRGSYALLGLMIFCAGWAGSAAILCRRLRSRRPGTAADFSDHSGWQILGLVGALLLLTGSLLPVLGHVLKRNTVTLSLSEGMGTEFYLAAPLEFSAWSSSATAMGIVGALAACCLGAVALNRARLREKSFWLSAAAMVFALARLIYNFRTWSRDPMVIDFAPHLLASIAGVLSLLMLAGYDLKVGRRAVTVFWSLCTAVFTALLLPDALLRPAQTTLSALLSWLGIGLFCFAGALQLLTGPEPVEEEEAPEAAEPGQEESASAPEETEEAPEAAEAPAPLTEDAPEEAGEAPDGAEETRPAAPETEA